MPTMTNRTMAPLDWALLLALSVLWGGLFFFQGVAVRELPPLTIVVLRLGLGAVILNLALRAVGERLPRERGVGSAFLAIGLIDNALPFCLIVWARPTSPPASPRS